MSIALLSSTPIHSIPATTDRTGPGDEFGVFVRLAESVPVPFNHAVAAIRSAITASPSTLLAEYAAGVERGDCVFGAHVFVLHLPEYSEALLRREPYAAFAAPLRLAVFEDEAGVHVSATNPASLNRTIVAETGFEAETARALGALRGIVAAAFPGVVTDRQYGQMRHEGLIGKTMGIIAGGPFRDKVEEIILVPTPAGGVTEVAQKLYAGLERLGGTRRWGTRPLYRLDFPERGVVIIGVTGEAMESRAFQIVGSGSDGVRDGFACPGIDHAPAFPLELVIARDGDRVRVSLIDAMFRMKMFFEDAGKMKFAANMRMPGSIENEIRDKVEESLY